MTGTIAAGGADRGKAGTMDNYKVHNVYQFLSNNAKPQKGANKMQEQLTGEQKQLLTGEQKKQLEGKASTVDTQAPRTKLVNYESMLFLGRTTTLEDKEVTESDLNRFIKNHVHPFFPGFTVFSAKGFWHGLSEDTTILYVLHAWDERRFIEYIAKTYKEQFNQESVLVRTSRVEAVFI